MKYVYTGSIDNNFGMKCKKILSKTEKKLI